jgi:hypothetical protein
VFTAVALRNRNNVQRRTTFWSVESEIKLSDEARVNMKGLFNESQPGFGQSLCSPSRLSASLRAGALRHTRQAGGSIDLNFGAALARGDWADSAVRPPA